MHNIKAYLQLLIFMFLIRARLTGKHQNKIRSLALPLSKTNPLLFLMARSSRLPKNQTNKGHIGNNQRQPSIDTFQHSAPSAGSRRFKFHQEAPRFQVASYNRPRREIRPWTHQTIGLSSLKLTVRIWKYGRAPRRKRSLTPTIYLSGASF